MYFAITTEVKSISGKMSEKIKKKLATAGDPKTERTGESLIVNDKKRITSGGAEERTERTGNSSTGEPLISPDDFSMLLFLSFLRERTIDLLLVICYTFLMSLTLASMFIICFLLTILVFCTIIVACVAVDAKSCQVFLPLQPDILVGGCLAIPFFIFLGARIVYVVKEFCDNLKHFEKEYVKASRRSFLNSKKFEIFIILLYISFVAFNYFESEIGCMVKSFYKTVGEEPNFTKKDEIIIFIDMICAIGIVSIMLSELSTLEKMRVNLLVKNCERMRSDEEMAILMKNKFELTMDTGMECMLFALDFIIGSIFTVVGIFSVVSTANSLLYWVTA